MPGNNFRIVVPVTLEGLPPGEEGLILIGGVQVMKGYFGAPEKIAEVIVELDGQALVQDRRQGPLDEDGFLTIVDRYSRFANLGGEMVSLILVEDQVRRLLDEPELELVVSAVSDFDGCAIKFRDGGRRSGGPTSRGRGVEPAARGR